MPIKRVFVYKIDTPLYNINSNSLDDNRYDHDRFSEFLSEILKQNINDRAYRFNNKFILLENFQDSDDADFIEGFFIATRYGEEQDIYDVDSIVKTGTKGDREGVISQVSFVLCKRTGLLLVQSDSNRVVSRNSIDKYFTQKQSIFSAQIQDFNRKNNPYLVPESMFFTISTIVSDDFFNKLSQLVRIKKATVFIDITKNDTNAASLHFKQEAEESDVDNYNEVAISLVNSKMGTGIRNVKKLFKNIIELEKYDRFQVEGFTSTNSRRTVDISSQPMYFEVEVTQNSNGIIDRSLLVEDMVYLAKHDNPCDDEE